MLIQYGNINSKILKCTEEEYKLFRDSLTFVAEGYWFSPQFKAGIWDGKVRLFRKRQFPTGLLSLVRKNIPDLVVRKSRKKTDIYGVVYNILNTKKMEGRYAYQLDVVKTAVKRERGILSVATGGGKTCIAAAIIKVLDVPTLFLVPTKDLLIQTHKVFTEEIGKDIGIWGAGKEDLQKITVAMPKTISNRLSKKKYKDFIEEIKCVFTDECHLCSAETWQVVLKACKDANFRYGLSGTPLCKTELKNANVMAYLGEEIYKISNDDLIKLKANSVPTVTFIKIRHATEEEKYPEIYADCVVNSKIRNRKIVEKAISLLRDSEIVLILVQKIEHGEKIKQIFFEKGKEVAFCYGNSELEVRQEAIESLRNKKSNILILSRIGELGIDIPYLSTLIYAGGGKSTVGSLQRIGRLLRNPTKGENHVSFYDFYDSGISYLEEHSQKRLEDYRNEGFEIRVV